MKKPWACLSRKKGKMIFTMKTRLKVLLLFIVLCFFPFATTGQPGNPPHHPPGHGLPGDQKPHDTPPGSGLVILTLVGLAWGIRKTLKDHRRDKP